MYTFRQFTSYRVTAVLHDYTEIVGIRHAFIDMAALGNINLVRNLYNKTYKDGNILTQYTKHKFNYTNKS